MQAPRLTDLKAERARRAFYAFCRQMADFDWKDNWHLRHIAAKLQDVVEGRCKRLILTIPFRHGKSQLGSRFLPAYFLGKYPDRQVIGTSSGASLAIDMSRDAKRVINRERYKRIFPDTQLNARHVATDSRHEYKNTADEWEIVDHRGGYKARGVGQQIQGHGAHLAIIDDVFGSREDAYSETKRERVKDWYDNDLSSRLSKDGAIVIINTRMHHDDLIGYLLERQKKHDLSETWEVVNFPAIKETDDDPSDPREIGEALWPWRMPAEKLLEIKKTRPDIYWGAYQGKPTPPGGTIVKSDHIRHWTALPSLQGRWVQSWDFRAGGKSKTSSYAVAGLWLVPDCEPANAYLVDQVRGRWDINESVDQLVRLSKDPLWSRADEKLVENKADGRAIIPMLSKHVTGIVPVNPGSASKIARFEAVAPFFRSGNVLIPERSAAPWVDQYIHEITSFPGSANDDQVDQTAQALSELLTSDVDDGDEDIYEGWLT